MTRRMLNIKIVVAQAAMVFTGGVFAIDLPAPGADGKIVLNAASGNYVATADVVCTQVVFSANNISVDLSADGGKTISIPSTVTAEGFAFFDRYFAASISGGTWDFGGGASLKVGSSHHDHAITFDGTKVRNVKGATIGDNRRNCRLTLMNGAELVAESMRITSGANSDHCTFEILGGSTALFSGNFIADDGTTVGSGSNALTIDGAGSSLSVPNKAVLFGRGCSNDRMVVTDGGSATLLSLTIGGSLNGTSATNTCLTVGDATLMTTENLTIGGSSFGNMAAFTNATLSVKSIVVGSGANSTNNMLVLAGSTLLTQSGAGDDPFFFGNGGNNEVVLTSSTRFQVAI